MSYYYYLDISLEFDKEYNRKEVTPAFFKKHVMQSVRVLFGEIGASIDVDVLKYEGRRAILRVPADFYVKLHSALTVCGHYEGIPCAYIVHKTSALLLSLSSDSREFKH